MADRGRVSKHMEYMRNRKAMKKAEKDKVRDKRRNRMKYNNPKSIHTPYKNPSRTIPTLHYEPPSPPQMISQ